ncbi:hypothetical protein [Variovorax sp. Sphag1AA]|uniref:hypothetical protein n=1 Tax=Variovorax sp. Sphag1AA TaxID=2587027 RepID=UPI001608668D|nr:hypothetical protein [Variovorax sp. Sphag1AA]MBB3178696.1 hypothetical protein [Variovorax sp. Sphag1AA]
MDAIDRQVTLDLIRAAAEAVEKVEAFLQAAQFATTTAFDVGLAAELMLDERNHVGDGAGAGAQANPETIALSYCLLSLRYTLDVSRLILQRPLNAHSQEAVHQNRKLADDAKMAGRAAYLSALALWDPTVH